MKEHIDLMDKAIKEKFDGHEVPVPSHLWNSIESNLAPENGNIPGGGFFKNPFLLSILVISTVLIGTYLYHSSNKQTADNSALLKQTTTATDVVNISSSAYSANDPYNQSSLEEKNHTSNSLSNNNPEGGNKTANYSSNTPIESPSNTYVSKNKTTAITPNYKNIHHTSSKSENKAGVNNTYSTKNSNNNISNKNPHQNAVDKNNTTAASLTQTILSSSDATSVKENINNHSSSTASNTPTPSESKFTNAVSSSNTQALNSGDLENYISTTRPIDSIKIDASAFFKEFNSLNNMNNAHSNIVGDHTVSKDNTISNNISSTASNQTTYVNASSISNALLSLDSSHTITKASETILLYNKVTYENESNVLYTKKTTLTSNTNSTYETTSLVSVNSINNRNNIENSFYTNLKSNNDTNSFTSTKNESANALVLKVDSTMIDKHIDTSSVQKSPEKIEVKSSLAEKNKKTLFLSRCSFDGYATPALAYMYLSSNSNQEDIDTFTKERNKNTNAGFGITTGLRMNYALTQKIEIGIGFQYSSSSQQSFFTQQHLDSSYTYQGYTQTDSTYDTTSHHVIYTSHFVVTDSTVFHTLSSSIKTHTDKFQNFSIPIHIAYGYSISNKVSLLARTSLLINYQTYSVTYLNEADGSIIGYHSNKNISLGGSISIGCYYQFSRKCSVFVEPIVTYYFSNVFDKQVPFKQKQLMLGLQTGIRLSF